MSIFIYLKNFLPRLAAVLLSLFTAAGFAEEPRPTYKIAIFRSDMPFAIEVEKGLKEGLAKLGYVQGQHLTYLPTVVVKLGIENYAATASLVNYIQTQETGKPGLFATGVTTRARNWPAS